MDNEKNNSGTPEGGEVKKKKFTVVFRTENSQQNSLKSRPQTPQTRKPAGTAQAQSKPAPARPQGNAAQPAKTAAKPAEEPQKTAVKPAENVKPAAAPEEIRKEVKAEVKPAASAAEKPAAKAAEPVKPQETKAAEPAKPAETQKPAEPVKPAPRFVDMSQVRAAEQEAKDRSARLARQQADRAQQNARGERPAQGSRRPQGSGTGRPQGTGTGRPQGNGTYQNRNGQQGGYSRPAGDRPYRPAGTSRPGSAMPGSFDKDKDEAAPRSTARRPASGTRPGAGRPGTADFGGLVTKTQAQGNKNTKQNPRQNTKDDRYKNAENDEMRRPGGKGGKGTKNIKDLEKTVKSAPKNEVKEPEIKTITIPETLTIKELADAMKMQPSAIIKKLFLSGKVVTVNQEIDYDTAADIALDFDIIAEQEVKVDVIEELLKDSIEDKPEDLVPRPPVVCVMGHVDHGKTSLLDAIRKTSVTTGEAGGITQHIGAYMVEINGQKITFLDTPGHEAFTAMRMRGAQATDIAILVVAADDGVMPQTVEAINHAKAAGVEVVVAINKIDKPGANIDRVKKELTEYGLIGEEWGGSNIFVPISAKRGDGIEELLEMLLLVAEMHELKANPNRNARGLVIEAQLDNTRGPVATILIQKGSLHVGDHVAAGGCYGKIRAMLNDKGEKVNVATPGTPVVVLGLSSVPSAGEVFISTNNEKDARSYAQTFIAEGRKKLLDETKSKMSLDDLFNEIKAGNLKELNLIVKADVQGSVEAVKTSLMKLSNDEVVVKVIHSAAGNINESDVTLASASNAIIIGFNVKPDNQAKAIADSEKVDIRLYDVIYKAIEDVEAAMVGMLDPVYEEQIIGHAVVRQVFKASGIGFIAGSFILDGKIVRGCKCRVTRGKDQLFDGSLASLKRFKDDVKEVAAGYECGLVFDGFGDFAVDDTIEAYTMVEIPRKLPAKKG